MALTYRRIAEDEYPAFVRANEAAFSAVPSEEDVRRERTLSTIERCIVAVDGAEIVGTSDTSEMSMAVPGAEIPIGYVTSVGVKPSHRRQGIATELMRRQLVDARERGEAVSVLYASEGAIYGRFGYGLATVGLSIDVESSRSAFVRPHRPAGTVRLVERQMAVKDVLAVHDMVRPTRPGMVALDETRFEYSLHDHGPERDQPTFFALHEGERGVDGYVAYRVRHRWPGGNPSWELTVRDLLGATPQAVADLWRFVLDVDLVERVRAWSRPVDEPLLYLVAEPRRLRATLHDNLWLRPVDVAAALRARRYAAGGRVVLEVHDAFCTWNDGRYELEADGEGDAVVTRTSTQPDLACSAGELGAVYLGGSSLRQLHRAGRVDELRPGGLARADGLFAWDPAPWCPYDF